MATNRKIEIRNPILDVIFERVEIDGTCRDFESLAFYIAKLTQAPKRSGNIFDGDCKLSETDRLMLNEVLHDLYIEKIITPGFDSANMNFPWFRLHSEIGKES